MGCYNVINANCPNCKAIIEIQSKGGTCAFEEFSIVSVPIADALYIENTEVFCRSCGYTSTVAPIIKLSSVTMLLE